MRNRQNEDCADTKLSHCRTNGLMCTGGVHGGTVGDRSERPGGGPADGEGPRMHGDLPSPKLCVSVFCCLSLKIFRIWAVLPLEELISFKTENKLS